MLFRETTPVLSDAQQHHYSVGQNAELFNVKAYGSYCNHQWHGKVKCLHPGADSAWEMSTRKLPGGKGRPARKADNLSAICELIV
jgi:hypothetical protein